MCLNLREEMILNHIKNDMEGKSYSTLTNDEISNAFTNCKVLSHTDPYKVKGGDLAVSVVGIAKTLTSTVQDAITGATHYTTQS